MAPTRRDPHRERRSGITRRGFLKSTGASGIAASVVGLGQGEAEAQNIRLVGPGDVPVTLTVNGRRVDLRIEPRVTLLDALRQRADLTGHKRACDRGACGACSMIVDGRLIYGCSTLAIDSQGKQIRTVEGLSSGTALHPVQQAFCDTDALMCGFCTPGFVMATVALLEKVPRPTEAQARNALEGNICRCGPFSRILEAATTAQVPGRV